MIGRRAVQATARLNVAGVDGLEVARMADSFDVVFAHAVAEETLRQQIELWRQIARVFVGEYAAAVKKGQKRGRRHG